MKQILRNVVLRFIVIACANLVSMTFAFAQQPSGTPIVESLYPIHGCNFPRFNTDRKGCYNFQSWWNKANVAYWANCPWHLNARVCWNQDLVHWRCPRNKKVPHKTITTGDLIRLHDWSVKIFRDANDDGEWVKYPKAAIAWQYLNGMTTDIISLGFKKRKDMQAAVKALSEDDLIHLAKILVVYSSINDTLDWIDYALERVPKCSTDRKVESQFRNLRLKVLEHR